VRARWFALGLLTAALLVFGALLPLALPRACRVNRAAFERIEEGMTEAEVEEILGGPPGDYRTGPPPEFESHFSSGPLLMDLRTWQGDDGDAEVCFRDGRVSWKVFGQREGRAVAPVEMIRWRLDRLRDSFRN
jgi:hypothetical protein